MPFAARNRGEPLQIRLLGDLEVVRRGDRQPLPASRKTRGLLAYLAVAPRLYRRDELCDLLWADVSDPRRDLRWSLSKLRKLLGPWLVASPDVIGIARGELTVDVLEFRKAAASSRSRRDLTEALDLWRGEPLTNAGVPDSHHFHLWWMAEREALKELHRRLLHEQVDRLWPSPNDALVMARRLVALYPLDEWGHVRVTQALERCGRRSEGHAYRATAGETLNRELGIPPASVFADAPAEPVERRAFLMHRPLVSRPTLAVLPLDVGPPDDAACATAMNAAAALALGLWQSGLCDVVELHWPSSAPQDVSYAVCGSLTRLGRAFRLSLRCLDTSRGTVLWAGECGPFQSTGEALADALGTAISAIQSLIQATEIRRAVEYRGDRDRDVGKLLGQVFGLASSLEPHANQQALKLLDLALNEAPDDPLALSLGAWCHVQRSIYQWSASPETDRLDAKSLNLAATRLGGSDPICLTILGTTRTMLADQNGARALLGRALELNPYSSWANARMGWVDAYLGRAEGAIGHFQKALRLAPRDPGIFNTMTGLGIAYFISGKHGRAIEWMEKGLALNPKAVWINRNLAPAYIAAGHQDEGERCVSALLDEYPKISIAAVLDAMVMSRPTMMQIAEGLARAGLPTS